MTVKNFLCKYRNGADNIDVDQTINAFVCEMRAGLGGKSSSVAMLPTYLYDGECATRPDEKFIVIDAGGTNFRSAIAYFTTGSVIIEREETVEMPASDKRLSADEFYTAIAKNIERLLPYARDIGFCFSFPVKMTEDCDGTVLTLPKGIDAPEVAGTQVGKSTLDAVYRIDDRPRKITILNDTVAVALGANMSVGCAHIGYIYGTGTNVCCTVRASDIKTAQATGGRMLVNTECGNFDKFERGAFEKAVALMTGAPDEYAFEKAVSGKYLAAVVKQAFIAATEEGLLGMRSDVCGFTLENLSDFLNGKDGCGLKDLFVTEKDKTTAAEISIGIIDRAAKLGAIANAATAVFSDDLHVEIAAEGSTFYKLYGYRDRFEKHLESMLGKRGIAFDIVDGGSNSVGALVAAAQRYDKR